MNKIINWFKSLFATKIDYKKLYENEVLYRQDAERCLFTLRAQIKAVLKESKCKNFNGEGL